MNRTHLALLLVLLGGCGGADRAAEAGPDPILTLRGVHDRVDGIDVWTDSVPPRRFEIVEQNVDLGLDASDAGMVFPATRIRSAADRARELDANAAMIRTRRTETPTGAAGATVGYEYDIDIVRYVE